MGGAGLVFDNLGLNMVALVGKAPSPSILGMCRFHRLWAEAMLPEVIGSLYGKKQEFLERIMATASRINSRNSSIFWESERNVDIVSTFLKRHRDVEGDTDKDLGAWIDRF